MRDKRVTKDDFNFLIAYCWSKVSCGPIIVLMITNTQMVLRMFNHLSTGVAID